MDCFIHDLSLNSQYGNSENFFDQLKQLMRLRHELPVVKQGLRCSRMIADRPVTPLQNFREVMQECKDHNLRNLTLQWIQSNGPFWDDERELAEDDYFECAGYDVTEQGAGEAARRASKGFDVATYSFASGGFDSSPLSIQHGLSESPLGNFELRNYWDVNQLQNAARAAIPKPESWEQTIEQARLRFPKLLLADYLIDPLRRETFTSYLAERIFELLGKLHEFVESRSPDGTYSPQTYELIDNHFAGQKAWFTDESDTNKTHFEKALSFVDPSNSAISLFCPWHGKIKTPQYRIHFPWPLQSHETQLRIVYIGPKITKT